MLQETINNKLFPKEVIATPEWVAKHPKLLKNLPKSIRLNLVTFPVLEAALTTSTPDGVACLLDKACLPKLKHKPHFVLALDRLQDPGNVGTLFRTALAADIDILWLALGADPCNQKVLRSSAGAVFQLPFLRWSDSVEKSVEQLADNLRISAKDDYQVVGTYPYRGSDGNEVLPYWNIDWLKPTVLVLGNEGDGLHPRIKDCCTHYVTLPHSQAVESLNVASSAVPLLLERRRAKMTTYMNKNGEQSKF
ncbi:TRNA/rRNA methyltransferase (SpoU) [Prochlorococcus sp. MIT 0601]|nr:TRNA/rRNA methyltransferase (SpoU) [Prochlorococcus sp. MIT 0601]